MKKVINITLGSVVFAIEQDAYDILASYLSDIKNNLIDTDDAKEVVDDIESAIAEKFIARKRSEKIAITVSDIETIIGEMGRPVDFSEGENVDSATSTEEERPTGEIKKRLYRDTDNGIIAGVASGLARYFDIDPVIIRLIFAISVFFNGLGILAYLILWLVVPVAKTTADKYAMRGEQVTLKDISERVKKNIQDIENSDLKKAKGMWLPVRNVLNKIFQIIGIVIKGLIVALRYAVSVAMIVGGALGIAGMVSAYSVILLSDKVVYPEEVQVVLETLLGNPLGIVAMISSFIMMTIPLVVVIFAGASLLVRRNFFTVQKAVTLGVVWIVAAVVAGTTSFLQVEQVLQKQYSADEDVSTNISTPAISYKDATYVIEGKPVQLTDGYNESEMAPSSASMVVTKYFGNELFTDLDGDGDDDIAFILTQETGGSGTFYYAVAAINTDEGYIGSDGYFLGDRIAPQPITVSPNSRHKNVVVFNYATRGADEPMTAVPSVGESVYLKIVPETLRWAIVEPDFEGESAF